MKREAGFSFRHQASDLNPAGASKSLSVYHHHPAMFVFWFLANNVTQMHMLGNKRRWTCFCRHQIVALHVLITPPLSEEIPQKKPQICPQDSHQEGAETLSMKKKKKIQDHFFSAYVFMSPSSGLLVQCVIITVISSLKRGFARRGT